MKPNMGIISDAKAIFDGLVGPGRRFENKRQLSLATGVEQKSFDALMRDGGMTFKVAARALDDIGAKIILPGEGEVVYRNCVTPEAAYIDSRIAEMRERGDPEEAIRDFAVTALRLQFDKKSSEQLSEQTKRAC
jgi:hypothetical protein